MRLVHDNQLFSKDVIFENGGGPIAFDTGHSYKGSILGKFFLGIKNIIIEKHLTNENFIWNFDY